MRSQLPATRKGLFPQRYDNTLKVWDERKWRRSLVLALFCYTIASNGVDFLRLEGIEPLT
ncbi:hypothetical protein [Microcoleus sp. N9_A1]|uniref:hypothetical protein n=1 Tax=Microcoleus sp. N9_A1 TaxID=3055380 RepID=UPI002FD5BCF2